MKRNPSRPAGGSLARDNSRLWMVGTAEYQVAPESGHGQPERQRIELLGTATVPPDCRVESVDATSP